MFFSLPLLYPIEFDPRKGPKFFKIKSLFASIVSQSEIESSYGELGGEESIEQLGKSSAMLRVVPHGSWLFSKENMIKRNRRKKMFVPQQTHLWPNQQCIQT